MSLLALRSEERVALIAALAAHGALVAWLAWQRVAPSPVPERMVVTLTDKLGPVSTSPDPMADPAPDKAPEIGEAPPKAEPQPRPQIAPEPVRSATIKTGKTETSSQDKPPPKPVKKPGASALDRAFAAGMSGASGRQPSQAAPATAPSAQQVSSWSSSIGTRVRGPWNACAVSGLEAEKLVVTVRFTLERSGAIASMEDPVVSGVTDSNRPQVARYKECAVRAIRTAAPFDNLPGEYYDFWKSRRLNFRKQ